jgi:hypothetical protein
MIFLAETSSSKIPIMIIGRVVKKILYPTSKEALKMLVPEYEQRKVKAKRIIVSKQFLYRNKKIALEILV